MITSYKSPVHAAEAVELKATAESNALHFCETIFADQVGRLESRAKHSKQYRKLPRG
jgi:hypothetical protein